MRLKPFYSMRRLPCWGQQLEPINFEWPTEEVWNNMESDVNLISLEFKDEGAMHRISSVRTVYSDPQYTRTLEKLNFNHCNHVKLTLS